MKCGEALKPLSGKNRNLTGIRHLSAEQRLKDTITSHHSRTRAGIGAVS